MEYIKITRENIQKEHICCAISNNDDIQVSSKKNWLLGRLEDGLVFLKGSERGKCFIEYIPAENAWAPICADGYMYIDCLWVSGSLSGHGYSSDLLNECISDSKAKGKSGLCILSSKKKKAFLADPKYLSYKGFVMCDESAAGIELWYLPFFENVPKPEFNENAAKAEISESGCVLYYTNQCPYTAKYVPVIEAVAIKNGIPFKAVHISTKEEAKSAPTPCTTYTIFIDGKFVTNEIQSDKKFLKLIADYKEKD